jgi:hypothetical protein
MCFPDGVPTVPAETKTEATAEVKEEVRTTSQDEQDYQDWQIAIRRMFRHKS